MPLCSSQFQDHAFMQDQTTSTLEKTSRAPFWLLSFGIFPAPCLTFAHMAARWLDMESGMGESPDLRVIGMTAVFPFLAAVACYLLQVNRKVAISALVLGNVLGLLLLGVFEAARQN